MKVISADFCPPKQLHWVESATGTEEHRDEGFIRVIPFDNAWLAGKLLGKGVVGVRLAPRKPLARDVIVCAMCRVACWLPS